MALTSNYIRSMTLVNLAEKAKLEMMYQGMILNQAKMARKKGSVAQRMMSMEETSNASSVTKHILAIPPYTHICSRNIHKDQMEKLEIPLQVEEVEEDLERM